MAVPALIAAMLAPPASAATVPAASAAARQAATSTVTAGNSGSGQGSPITVTAAAAHDTSESLRTISERAAATSDRSTRAGTRPTIVPQRPNPGIRRDAQLASNPAPPVFPDPTGPVPGEAMPPIDTGFPGLGVDDQLDPSMWVFPPDTDGDIGPNNYVQIVNLQLAVFDRAGNRLMGPLNNNLMWLGFAGGNCSVNNDGDPIVQYDQYADRWLITQFSVNGPGYYECLAVSTTPDPMGSYHRYAFAYDDFPDYPKFGVWPDAYYVTYNMFDDLYGFDGVTTCALERAQMLAGGPARQQCVHRQTEASLLPSDATGPTPPPAGSPNYIVGESYDDNELLTMYKFSVNWANPAASTFVGPISLQVSPFTWACLATVEGRGQCIPQPGTSVLLESLGARMMYRLDYRNFGTHESLVMNHTVAMDGDLNLTTQTGLGWYELRNLDQPVPTVYQQGTSADPDDTTYRWMASIAQDKSGNMALGYSFGSAGEYASIGVVGRLADDPLNQMTQEETLIKAGGREQLGSRWGDYSSMQVDPVDDCTFWYTNEYLAAASGPFNWSSWIANFKYPGCSGAAVAPQAPASATSAPANRSAVVSWTPPASNGGMAVVGYRVTATPGLATCSSRVGVDPNPLSCTLTGLTNGTAYQLDVTAYNAIGDSAATRSSVTPASVPEAPGAVTGTRGAGQVAVSWAGVTDDGGAPVTSYTATAHPGGATCSTPAGAVPVPTGCTVGGLTNGVPYTFTVAASNAFGISADSAPSAPVTPATVPDQPSGVFVAAGDRSVNVAWVAPAFDGGSPLTAYTAITTSGGSSCTVAAPQTSCLLGGLANGTSYTVQVIATNSVGNSAPSVPSTAVTPAAPRFLTVSVPATVGPGVTVPVAISGAGPGCRVDVTFSGAKAGGLVDALGAASFAMPAPQPNGTYPVAATQSGANCVPQQASAAVVVSGVYITGASKLAKGKSATYKGREFPAKKTVKWKLVRKGKTVATKKVKSSKSGVSKAKFKFSKKGTYTLTATQGTSQARYEVQVG